MLVLSLDGMGVNDTSAQAIANVLSADIRTARRSGAAVQDILAALAVVAGTVIAETPHLSKHPLVAISAMSDLTLRVAAHNTPPSRPTA